MHSTTYVGFHKGQFHLNYNDQLNYMATEEYKYSNY